MHELSQILADATQAIEPAFFQVPIAGGESVFRERVYCYELYHQMRSRWPNDCGFCLNGELDKAGHAVLKQLGIEASKPDFLVHRPGDMAGNHAIIEVKPAGAGLPSIQKDLRTLSAFTRRAGYERAIYLFFGGTTEQELIRRLESAIAGINTGPPSFEAWLHRVCRDRAHPFFSILPEEIKDNDELSLIQTG